MTKRNLWRLVAALTLGGGIALGMPALEAVGQFSPPIVFSVEIQDPATLVAKGAAASVTLEVTCPAGSSAFVGVQLTQRAGSRVANGGGSEEITCTGSPQTVEILVPASGSAFKKGTAVAQANVFTCVQTTCEDTGDTEVISLVR